MGGQIWLRTPYNTSYLYGIDSGGELSNLYVTYENWVCPAIYVRKNAVKVTPTAPQPVPQPTQEFGGFAFTDEEEF